jgi:hypothetical protein
MQRWLVLCFLLVPAFYVSACGGATHPVYTYAAITCPTSSHHADGDTFATMKQPVSSIAVQWRARFQGDSEQAIVPVQLQMRVLGPYPALGSFGQSWQADGTLAYTPTTPVIGEAPLIRTTNSTNATYLSRVLAPHGFVAGYYQVIEEVDEARQAGSIRVMGRCLLKIS